MSSTARSTWPEGTAGVRLTAVQRWALDSLAAGISKPASPLQLRTFKALVAKGLAEEIEPKKVYRITPAGDAARQRKMGRPSEFRGAWAKFADAFGGPVKLAQELQCSYQSVNQWALHGVLPSRITSRLIKELAEKKGVPNPLECCPSCGGALPCETCPATTT